jgi:hypothetical protein
MLWSEVSKREWRRRRDEQVKLLTDNVTRIKAILAKPTVKPTFFEHRKMIVVKEGGKLKEKLGPWLEEEELRAHIEEKLRENEDSLQRWMQPLSFEIVADIIPTPKAKAKPIPEDVQRAMRRVRRRTVRKFKRGKEENT